MQSVDNKNLDLFSSDFLNYLTNIVPNNNQIFSNDILNCFTQSIQHMKHIFNVISKHHITLCLMETKLLNLQTKLNNLTRTQQGIVEFNDIYDKVKYLFSNILQLRHSTEILMKNTIPYTI